MKNCFRIFAMAGLFAFCMQVWADSSTPIKFGILSIAQPARIHAKWQPFVKYLSAELDRPVEIVIPRGFEKMRKAATNGEVDFFYVNSHVFYRLKQAGKAIGGGANGKHRRKSHQSQRYFCTARQRYY